MTDSYANAGILVTDPAYLGTADQPATGSHLLTVGPGKQFATLAAAVAAAGNGDVIAITGGITLTNDFADVTQKNLTIEGVGGMVSMVATIPPPNSKGILVIDAPDGGSITIKNISFSGVAISAGNGGNGAGIRYDSGNLTVINSNFTNNQDGILANPDANGNITIDHSTFSANGSGSGFTHDIYIGDVANFTLSNSVVSSAIVGHEVKSRANNTTIINNIIQDGPTGTGSYDIDLPNGGNALIQGNSIEKGPNAQNDVMISYGEEGNVYANSALTVSGNALINDLGPQAVALVNKTLATALVSGNSFSNIAIANLVSGAAALSNNVTGTGAAIANTTQGTLTAGSGIYVFNDSLAHTLSFTDYNQGAQGSAGLLTITSAWGHETVYGGSGGLNYTDTGPAANEWADVITTAANSTNVINVIGGDSITSAGTDMITLGVGNSSVAISGTATISGGSGTESYAVQGGGTLNVTLAAGSSNSVTVANGGSATVIGVANSLAGVWQGGTLSYSISEGGQHVSATFVGGAGQATVNAGLATIVLSGGGSGSVVTLGDGAVNLTSVGSDMITAGSGSDTILVSGNATITAGTGQLSVYGHGETGVATIYGNSGTTLINGDSGGVKYVGSSAAGAVVDNLSHTEIDGGAGLLTISGTGFDRTIVGGAGGIDLVNAAGGDIISTAVGSSNSISLVGASTIVSNGSDQIVCGTGNITLTANGAASITGSQGNCNYILNGADSLTSYGTDMITVGAAASVQDVASGSLVTVNDSGGLIALQEIKNGDTVSVSLQGVGSIAAVGGSDIATITTTAGAADILALQGGNDVVHSNGADSITTGAGNDLIYASSAGDRITINAQQTAHAVTISNFNASNDRLVLSGFSGAAVASEQVNASGLVINLSDGGTLTLSGLTQTLPVSAAGALSLAVILAPAGSYVAPGSSAPVIDPAGTYSAAGATAPVIDPAGTYSAAGAAAPTIDPAGTYSAAGAAAPTIDPAGTYSAAGATAPTIDPAGTYSAAGASAPTVDPTGTYSAAGASAPTAAPAGFYDPGTGNTAPIPDPPGTIITANTAYATTVGTAANDLILVSAYNQTLNGGGGIDLFQIDNTQSWYNNYSESNGGTATLQAGVNNAFIGVGNFSPANGITSIDLSGHSGVVIAGDGSVLNLSGVSIQNGTAVIDAATAYQSLTGTSGNDVIVVSSYNQSLNGGGGIDLFQIDNSQTWYNSYSDSGTATLQAGVNNAFIGLGNFGPGNGVASIDLAGHSGVIIAGNAATLNLSAVSIINGAAVIDAATAYQSLTGTSGNDVILVSSYNQTLNGGGGTDLFQVENTQSRYNSYAEASGGTATIQAGVDNAFIGLTNFAPGNGIGTIDVAGHAGVVIAGAGRTLNLSAVTVINGTAVIDAATAYQTVVGAAGNNLFTVAATGQTLTGGSGTNQFQFMPNFGSDMITNFQAGSASGYGILDLHADSAWTSLADVLAHATQQANGSLVIALNASDSITLEHVQKAALAANNFLFL